MKKAYIILISLFFVNCQLSILTAQIFSQFSGNGTSGNPYQITNVLDLQTLSAISNNIYYCDSTYGKYFKLMNDIDMTGVTWYPIGWSPYSVFNPKRACFYGNFDGNSNVIRNLTCISSDGDMPASFFANISGSTIVNLGIENCDIVHYFGAASGLVGSAGNSYISNCYVTGNLKGYNGSTVAGLVGGAGCTYISNCYFSGNLYAEGRMGVMGGLVGSYSGVCVGVNESSYYYYPSIISNCYVRGKVSYVNTFTYSICHIGGLIGDFYEGIVRNCVVALDSLLIANMDIMSMLSNPNPSYLNRIVGREYPYYIGVTLQNNYALNTMVVQDSNGNVNIGIQAHNTEAGASIPLDSLKSFAFYNRAANWYQTPWNIQNSSGTWKICDGQDLPFLRWQGIICNYAISATAGKNGSISPAGTVNVVENTNQAFTFSANTCYEIDSLWIDGVYKPDSIAKGSYTFKNVNENHSIKVSFKRLPPDTILIRDTVCYGADYTQNGFNITNATTDSVYFKFNTYGCDTVTRLELTVNPVYSKQISDTICKGDVYYFAGEELTENGIYIDTLQTISGCDSVIELTLTLISIDTTHISAEICQGDSYDFFGRSLTKEGIYYETLQNVHGCDSIIKLILTVTVGIVETDNYPSLPKIYPNPTTGKLKIESGELKMGNVEIYDIYGRKLSQFTFHNSHIEIDISHLSAGIYFLKIDGKTMKLVKE